MGSKSNCHCYCGQGIVGILVIGSVFQKIGLTLSCVMQMALWVNRETTFSMSFPCILQNHVGWLMFNSSF